MSSPVPHFPRRVGIAFPAAHSALTLAIAREMKKRTGCELYLYVPGEEALSKYRPLVASGLLVDVIDCSADFNREIERTGLDEKSVFAAAQEMERFIACTYNNLIMCRRDVGLAFSLGGFGYPRSPRIEKTTYVQAVNAFTTLLEFWRSELVERKIELFINATKDISLVARALDIPQRILAGSRHKNFYYWGRDEFLEFPGLQQAFKNNYDAALSAAVLDQPYFQDTKWRQTILGKSQIARLTRGIVQTVTRRLYLRYKGYVQQGTSYLSEQVGFLWRRYCAQRQIEAPHALPLRALTGRRFVFYPLNMEPEISLHGFSPEYFFQLGAVASIARDLPAGVFLAVKESMFGAGLRPRDFYAQIKAFKNVVFLDVRERGLDVIKAADAVVTITGTAGLEAAILGKPVVTFGRHNSYDFLAHVQPVIREEDLRPALRHALSVEFDRKRAVIDGANLLRALIEISFDLHAFDALKPSAINDIAVRNAVDALMRSFDLVAPDLVAEGAPA